MRSSHARTRSPRLPSGRERAFVRASETAARGWFATAVFAAGAIGLAAGVGAQPGGGAPPEVFGTSPSGEIPILFTFVQWVPSRHVVVVRYVEAAPPGPPESTPAPTPRPTRFSTPEPPRSTAPPAAVVPGPVLERYVVGDYLISPKIYNEQSTGNKSYEVKGAVEFPLFGPTWEIGANFRHVLYPHGANRGIGACAFGAPNCTVVGADPRFQAGLCPASDQGCVTTVGYQTQAQNGLGQIYVTAFTAQEDNVDAHFGLQALKPRSTSPSAVSSTARTISDIPRRPASDSASKSCPTSTTSSRYTAAPSTIRTSRASTRIRTRSSSGRSRAARSPSRTASSSTSSAARSRSARTSTSISATRAIARTQ